MYRETGLKVYTGVLRDVTVRCTRVYCDMTVRYAQVYREMRLSDAHRCTVRYDCEMYTDVL